MRGLIHLNKYLSKFRLLDSDPDESEYAVWHECRFSFHLQVQRGKEYDKLLATSKACSDFSQLDFCYSQSSGKHILHISSNLLSQSIKECSCEIYFSKKPDLTVLCFDKWCDSLKKRAAAARGGNECLTSFRYWPENTILDVIDHLQAKTTFGYISIFGPSLINQAFFQTRNKVLVMMIWCKQ